MVYVFVFLATYYKRKENNPMQQTRVDITIWVVLQFEFVLTHACNILQKVALEYAEKMKGL